ncbi:MAG: class I SAM-dependent methyltransferase [Flavobacteriaceae bacterium]|nr:class I SAM-dependent methyltransferase [Flavobacteriaceae bacterium]
MRKKLKSLLNRLPYVKGLYAHYRQYNDNACFPPGHYYSPIVSIQDIKPREDEIWKENTSDGLIDINLDTQGQVTFVGEILSQYYHEMPFSDKKNGELRFAFNNGMYEQTDGTVLYSMIRHLKPKRIIEIGSGHSSALMLDVNELFFNHKIHLTFIEPYPERLYKNIRETDKKVATILEKQVQEVQTSLFTELEAGDILFVDSSHVAKCGSDVNYIFFEILPLLNKGVYIHFHDIFYPFEYPKHWVYEGRNWNENYMLRTFLMNNHDYRIKVFSHYLHKHHKEAFMKMPITQENYGGNIWLEKLN